MKTIYKAYMDRQTVSADLHSKLLALEQGHPAVRTLPENHRRQWRGMAALAASLVLVVGLSVFAAQSGLFQMGSSTAARDSSVVEHDTVTDGAAPAEEAMPEEDADSSGYDDTFAASEAGEPAELPVTDAEDVAEPEAALPTEEAYEDTENTDVTEQVSQNAALLMEALPFTDKNAVLGAAEGLAQAGCGLITEIEVEEDDGQGYVLTVTDEEHNVFHTVMDYEGWIGPIQDGAGNSLYAPVE